MSIKENTLHKIGIKIRHHHRKGGVFHLYLKRFWMLIHELVRDDVAIRAESLSYFTLFSIMPLVAGLFLLVSAFSQWAPLQADFQELIRKVLEPIPKEHRENLLSFIFEFKDVYLQKISKTGSSLGFFAIVVLFGIMGKVFFNIEDLMNRIWSAKTNRLWIERIRNMVLSMVILPALIFTALSLPGLIERFGGLRMGVWVEKGVPILLLFSGLFFVFRYVPNTQVKPVNAIKGALLSGVLFLLSNVFLTTYFKFGTQTAYGKAAVLPIVAFFIYVSWILFMIGAEWSFVLQNEKKYTDEKLEQPNLQEAALLMKIFNELKKRHQEGQPPVTEEELYKKIHFDWRSVERVLEFLMKKGILLCSETSRAEKTVKVYPFCFSPENVDLREIIKDFLNIDSRSQNLDVNQVILLVSSK